MNRDSILTERTLLGHWGLLGLDRSTAYEEMPRCWMRPPAGSDQPITGRLSSSARYWLAAYFFCAWAGSTVQAVISAAELVAEIRRAASTYNPEAGQMTALQACSSRHLRPALSQTHSSEQRIS